MSERLGQSRTPSDVEVLRAAVNEALNGVHVALPGKVESYDSLLQKADVKPLVKHPVVYRDGTTDLDELPIIRGVPLVFPRAGGFFLSLPVAKGDTVLLVFCERSLDEWMFSTGDVDVDPDDTRKHDISDAVAIPGLFPFAKALKPTDSSGTDMKMGREFNGIQLAFTQTGEAKISFQGDAASSATIAEFLQTWWNAALVGVKALIDTHVHLAAGSPTGAPINATTLLPVVLPVFPTSAISSKVKIPST